MIRPFLAPRWLAWHGALVLVLVTFTLLGRWQLASFEASGAGGRDAAGAAAPAALSSVARPGERLVTAAVGRRVTVAGEYDAANQLLVPGRRHRGRAGLLVVTPLRTSEGVVPVNRGWVAAPTDAAVRPPGGPVTVLGVVQPSESEADARVDPIAALPPGQVPYLSTVQLLAALRYPPAQLYDGYVLLTSQRPLAAAPAPQVLAAPAARRGGVAPWRNLAYALQWWLFAGAAVVFWWMVLRRAAGELAADEGVVARGQ